MSTISIHRIQDGVLTSADSATLAVTNSIGATVIAAVAVPPTSAGVYSYTAPPLTAGTYTATWTFVRAGYTNDIVTRIFQVENAAAVANGITLAEIEQAIAARIGPYHKMIAYAGSSQSGATVRKLMSSIVMGDYEDLFLLRRGVMSTGELASGFNADDRQRIVSEYIAVSGRLAPDLSWTVAPAQGEVLELHYLDPENLREVALQGLRRCYFWDTLQVAATTYLSEINLTALAPWITRGSQIRRVQHGRYAYQTSNVDWFEAYQMGGDVWLRTTVPNIGTMRVSVLRPHFTFVNGEDSLVGPNHDSDILNIDREYAARAGHISAWMLQTPKLTPVAVQGLAITMKQAADAFTLSSMTYVKAEPERIQNRFGTSDLTDYGQIGNA